MKPIAYVLGTFPALTETFVLGEIEALRKAGVRVELFALHRPATAEDSSHGAELAARTFYGAPLGRAEIWRANADALRRAPFRYLSTLASVVARTALNPVHCLKSLTVFPAAAAFAERMRERHVGHVHAHWATYPATAAYVAARLLGISYSITAHVYDATLIRSLMREKLRHAAFVVTCNGWSAQRLAKIAPEAEGKIFLNYHGASLERFTPNGQVGHGSTPEILSVGSLYPRKGFPVLLEACRLLRDRGRDFHCTIVGEGPMRPRLEALIGQHRLEDRVHLAGALPHAEVIARYRSADLFALACMTDYLGWEEISSDPVLLLEVGPAMKFRPITDGIPNVLVEAMAMALPVVSTSVAGIPELVEDGRSGLLVPEQQPAALADALETLLADPERRRALGQQARTQIIEKFDRAKNIHELVHIFSRFVAPDPGAAHAARRRRLARAAGRRRLSRLRIVKD